MASPIQIIGFPLWVWVPRRPWGGNPTKESHQQKSYAKTSAYTTEILPLFLPYAPEIGLGCVGWDREKPQNNVWEEERVVVPYGNLQCLP